MELISDYIKTSHVDVYINDRMQNILLDTLPVTLSAFFFSTFLGSGSYPCASEKSCGRFPNFLFCRSIGGSVGSSSFSTSTLSSASASIKR